MFIEMQGSFSVDPSIKNQYEKCDLAICGTITNVEYLVYDNTPWSKIKIRCEDVLKGENLEDNTFTVYVLGGYLEKKSYEKNLVH